MGYMCGVGARFLAVRAAVVQSLPCEGISSNLRMTSGPDLPDYFLDEGRNSPTYLIADDGIKTLSARSVQQQVDFVTEQTNLD